MNGSSPIIAQTAVLLKRRDEQDVLNRVIDLREEYAQLQQVTSLSDLESVLPELATRQQSLNLVSLAFDWASVYGHSSFQSWSSALNEYCTSQRKLGIFYHHLADHQLRHRAYREAIRLFEQTLLYEANIQTRNDIFVKIAFSLYRLGSLQGLHYISIIKTNQKHLMGQIALINGLIHWEILKKIGKSFQFFNQAFTSLDHDPFLQTIAASYLIELGKILGDESGSATFRKVVERNGNLLNEIRIEPLHAQSAQPEMAFVPADSEQERLFSTLGEIPLHELERKYIQFILNRADSLEQACQVLEIDRKTLYNKRKAWKLV
ncbi:MAG: hypothetical protein HUU10_10410 [Bacteroidetes bacterium]|nr:hypothetical protein [Bacteroidota bacterium]